jgi:hypothetical protein
VKSRIWGSVNRFRSVEVLLRVLAFADRLNKYEGNLADFLNQYMHDHADASKDVVEAMIVRLSGAAKATRSALEGAGHGKLSLAIIEAVLVSSTVNQLIGEVDAGRSLPDRFNAMLEMPAFAQGARYAVSSVENVKSRLSEAMEAFRG